MALPMLRDDEILLGVCQTPVLRSREKLLYFLDQAGSLAQQAGGGPALFLLPELFWGGFVYDLSRELAAETSDLAAWLQEHALQRGLTLGGTFWEAAGDCLYNTFLLLGAGLDSPQRLRAKRHLFPMSEEQRHFTPDQTPPAVFSLHGIACGLGICFELRFPETFRLQAASGMDLALLSSQWPASRSRHLEILSHARAIENQCFLLSCNACGPSVLGELAGGSRLVSPWGEELFCCSHEPQVLCAPFSRNMLEKARAAFNTRPTPPLETELQQGS